LGKISRSLSGDHLRPPIQICFATVPPGIKGAEETGRDRLIRQVQLLELIANSSPHDAELFADRGVETESGTVLCNGIGKCHIVVADIDE
jgi:hypothetical protein